MANDDNNTTHPLMRRHYRTIGMGNVFLDPPPAHSLPSSYLLATQQQSTQLPPSTFLSREITGIIKSRPQDFIVREIALPGRYIPELSDQEIEASRLATLDDDHSSTNNGVTQATSCATLDGRVPVAKRQRLERARERHLVTQQQQQSQQAATSQDPHKPNPSIEQPTQEASTLAMESMSHQEVIETSIHNALQQQQQSASSDTFSTDSVTASTKSILQSIQKLEASIIQTMREHPHALHHDSTQNDTALGEIWIPPLASMIPRERGHFHRSMRTVYPLLSTDSVPDSTSTPHDRTTSTNTNVKSHKIHVTPDPLFWGLIPFLYEPDMDLPLLYKLYKGPFDEEGRPPATDHILLRLRPDLERSQRAPVHRLIAQKTRKALVTDTVNMETNDDGVTSAIRVSWSRNSKRKRSKRGNNNNNNNNTTKDSAFNSNDGHHDSAKAPMMNALFVVRKERLDHSAAHNILTKSFQCPRADLALAGKKDLHAITYQHATVQNCTPAGVAKVAEQLKHVKSAVHLGKAVSVPWLLQKGDLAGNKFELVLRQLKRIEVCMKDSEVIERMVAVDPDHLAECIKRVQSHGFVNFFGEQRVGKAGDRQIIGARPSEIGKALLQRKWRDAVDLIIQGRALMEKAAGWDEDEMHRGRLSWTSGGRDPVTTSKLLKTLHYLSNERVLLNGLKRYPGDYKAALECLPEEERSFWISTYQSLVWNRAAAERIHRYGSKSAVKGDLILHPSSETPTILEDEGDEEVDIRSVVLPLPGTSVMYPTNEIGHFYQELLKTDDIDFLKGKEQSKKGAYRHLVAPVSNLQYEFTAKEEVLEMQFELPSGSFATMMLRELMTTTVGRDKYS